MNRLNAMRPVIEGPARTRDISYGMFEKCRELYEIEQGIPVFQFSEHSVRRNKDLEYRLLKKITETPQHKQLLVDNTPSIQPLNRFTDVLPYVDNLVEVVSGRYINASWIDGSLASTQNRFIATQGPLPNTRECFWRMIWEFKCPLIVMICSVREAGRVKCDQYFPVSDSLTVDNFIIELDSTTQTFPNVTERKFIITDTVTRATRAVHHIQCTSWPDHGTPDLHEEFDGLEFILNTMTHYVQYDSEGKIILHCSAGIGRTGTLLSLFNLISGILESMRLNEEPRLSVFGTVRRMREQRMGMVQTKDQYDFLYQFMELWIKTKLITTKDR